MTKYHLDKDTVMAILQGLTENGVVRVKYEICSFDEVNVVKRVDDYRPYLGKELIDLMTEEYFTVTIDNIVPVYYINRPVR